MQGTVGAVEAVLRQEGLRAACHENCSLSIYIELLTIMGASNSSPSIAADHHFVALERIQPSTEVYPDAEPSLCTSNHTAYRDQCDLASIIGVSVNMLPSLHHGTARVLFLCLGCPQVSVVSGCRIEQGHPL